MTAIGLANAGSGDNAIAPMFDRQAEAMAPDERAVLQQRRLAGLIGRLLAAAGPQAARLRAAGVAGGGDVNIADLARLPTTSKRDLWDAYPFGLLAVPREEVVAVHGSSGTGGRPTLVCYSRGDIALWSKMCARALAAAGARPGQAGLTPGNGLSLRAGLFGAEPWTDQMRARIAGLLGISALDIYGLSEVIGPGVASECLVAADGLHVNEDHFLVEALDPVTGEPVGDGTPGELTFSTLTKQAMPLLRYRTGDIATLRHGDCACGRTLVKMSKVTGRKDDMLVIRGVNVYPSEIERVLLAEPEVAPDYLLVIDERDGRRDLIACCEGLTGRPCESPAAGPDDLRARLEAKLRDTLGVRVSVAIGPAGSVPRTEVGKAVRVRRWSGGEPPVAGLA